LDIGGVDFVEDLFEVSVVRPGIDDRDTLFSAPAITLSRICAGRSSIKIRERMR
jgi:hypothetical protein